MNDVVGSFADEQISVPKEVADFLEADRKREQAQQKRDQRHLSKSDFETVLSRRVTDLRTLEDEVIRNLTLEKLRNAVRTLTADERKLIFLYFDEELTMEEVGKHFGISKMAISKRLKKLYAKLRSSVETQGSSAFFIFWFTSCLRVSFIVRGTKTKRAVGVVGPPSTPGSSL